MKYRTFGRKTGLRVSELALGTGNFGTSWGHGADPAESKKMFDRYLEAGGNFIDTANGYQFGESEVIVGDLIKPHRDNLVLATKYTMGTTASDGLSLTGNNRKNMIYSVEASLKRLKTDRIDLYWVHMDDQMTPLEETMRGLDDLVRSGKILYAGFSNFPAWKIARADALAEFKNFAPLAGVQMEYSLAERTPDRELIPMIEALGFGAALWSPLGGGFLTGKYRKPDGLKDRLEGFGTLIHQEKTARETRILDTVIEIAKEIDSTPTHVSIAWLLNKADKSFTGLVPILGPRTLLQLEGTLGALSVKLSDEQVKRLNESGEVSLGVPHDIIRENIQRYLGGQAELFNLPKVPTN